MNRQYDNTTNTEKLLFGIFSLIGILFIIVSIVCGINGSRKNKEYEHVTGQIVDIVHHDDNYDVYVTYRLNGNEYDDILINTYTSNMREGADIKLLVDPDDPFKADSPTGTLILVLVFGLMGVTFACVGIIPLVIKEKRRKKNEDLVNNGTAVWAKVHHVEINSTYSVNNIHPRRIVAIYTDEYTGEEIEFISDNIFDIDFCDSVSEGSEVRVYMDRNDNKRYFVDYESINFEPAW